MPTAYTILFLLLILVAAATWIIPAGSYDYVDGVPVAGTYHTVEQNPQGVGDVLKAAFSGFYDAVDVCIFILMVGGFLGVVMKTGAVDAGVGNVIRLLGGREKWLIPILMLLFGLGGTTYGMWEETMAFYPLLIPVFLAAGYDAVVGISVILLGAGAGVIASTVNPFATGIAAGFAGVSLGEGIVLVCDGLRREGQEEPLQIRGGRGRGQDPGKHGPAGALYRQAEGHHGPLYADIPHHGLCCGAL